MKELINNESLCNPQIKDEAIEEFSTRIEEILNNSRDVAGITAEYIMTFLDRFDDDEEQLLIFALCSNFHRIQHFIEQQLLQVGVDVQGKPCNSQSFKDIGYLDTDFMEAIGEYLADRDKSPKQNKEESVIFQ